METRELFWSLGQHAIVGFYVLGAAAIAVFVAGTALHVMKYRRGRPPSSAVKLTAGAWRAARDLLTHRPLRRRDRFAGTAHAAIFFGFAVLFAGTALITLDYDILAPLTGVSFWTGRFYRVFSLLMDVAGVVLIGGILAMMLRRAAFGLAKLDYRRSYAGEEVQRPAAQRWQVEDWVFLTALLLIAVSGFLQEGLRLFLERPAWEMAWSPVGALVARGLEAMGLTLHTATSLRAVNWWLHGIAALAFIATMPWYKAKHMLAAIGSLVVRDARSVARLPRVTDDDGVGVAMLSDMSWKDMLHFDACTKCGRCHEACPARTAGYPLSPRDLILDLRLANNRRHERDTRAVAGDVIAAETLWACRTCGACKEICPVGVEHPTLIVQMRRHLVDQGIMDPLLQNVLGTVANTGNSFGESARSRGGWTKELPFRVKDARHEAVDLLWFVGDFASFDPRSQQVSRTVARLLRLAKVEFGILFDAERTAGNDLRRVGEEGLFETLAEHNLAQFGSARFNRLFTTDPHSFNTIRNEYPDFGAATPITHYSTMLRELLEAGRLKVVKPLHRRVTFHDPCHLGRLNGEYEAPRAVLRAIGCEIVEMPRSRDNAFCCGAGGGRIWLPDPPGVAKPAELRIREAVGTGAATLVTCCPKDLTMFEDARKTSGHEKDIQVADLAELVAEAVDLGAITFADGPALVDRISEMVADRMAASLTDKLAAAIADRLATSLRQQVTAPAAVGAETAERPAATVAPVETEWKVAPVLPARLPDYEVPGKTGRRLLVTVKHVGVLTDGFEISGGRHIDRRHFEFQLNEFDDNAIEQALLMAEALGGAEVVAATVGPPDAGESLRRALAKGADRAVRLWDDSLSDADPIAISRILAGVAVKESPDLILTGVQSSDLAHGVTGALLGRMLGWPVAAAVVAAEWNGSGEISITRELEGGLREQLRMPVPAVLTIQAGANAPRYATMRMIKQARNKPVAVLDGDLDLCPPSASVRRMAVPPATRAHMIEGTPEEAAAMVAQIIRDRKGV